MCKNCVTSVFLLGRKYCLYEANLRYFLAIVTTILIIEPLKKIFAITKNEIVYIDYSIYVRNKLKSLKKQYNEKKNKGSCNKNKNGTTTL